MRRGLLLCSRAVWAAGHRAVDADGIFGVEYQHQLRWNGVERQLRRVQRVGDGAGHREADAGGVFGVEYQHEL